MATSTLTLKRYEDIINLMPDGIVIVDPEGLIVASNGQIEKLFGYKQSELIGNKVELLIPQKYKKGHRKYRGDFVKSPHVRPMNIGRRLFGISKSGNVIPVDISLSPLKLNKRVYTMGVIRDVTHYSEMEQRLRGSEKKLKYKIKELNTFFYKTSHNLKGPIASIIGLLALAKSRKGDLTPEENLELISTLVQKLDKVISELSKLSKIEKGDLEISEIKFDDIIERVLNDLKYIPGFEQLRIKVLNKLTGTFYSDESTVISILHNLIENSVKYRNRAKKNSRLTISISKLKVKDKVKIRVTDNGLGIPNKLQDDVFNMFFRASQISDGSGMGLYIVSTAVKKLKGEIQLKSKYREGTDIAVYLPSLNK